MRESKKNYLGDYYNSLPSNVSPKTQFINKVAYECKVSDMCVRGWISGIRKPSNPDHIKIISQITGIDEGLLFT